MHPTEKSNAQDVVEQSLTVELGLRKGYLKIKGLEDIKEMPKFYRLASIVKDI